RDRFRGRLAPANGLGHDPGVPVSGADGTQGPLLARRGGLRPLRRRRRAAPASGYRGRHPATSEPAGTGCLQATARQQLREELRNMYILYDVGLVLSLLTGGVIGLMLAKSRYDEIALR